MEPWIDPRERRARWYFSALIVLSIGAFIAMIVLLVSADLTTEEIAIAVVTASLALLGAILAARHLKQLPREFRQHENPSESSSDSL